jgi:hypothetical protein
LLVPENIFLQSLNASLFLLSQRLLLVELRMLLKQQCFKMIYLVKQLLRIHALRCNKPLILYNRFKSQALMQLVSPQIKSI